MGTFGDENNLLFFTGKPLEVGGCEPAERFEHVVGRLHDVGVSFHLILLNKNYDQRWEAVHC